MESVYQGETVHLKFDVVDKDTGLPCNLTNATAVFSYKTATGVVSQNCVIEGSSVKASIPAATTAGMSGHYPYELKIRDASLEIDTLDAGSIKVIESIIPVFPAL